MTCVHHTCRNSDTRYHVAGQNVRVTGGQNQPGYRSVIAMVTTVVTIVMVPESIIVKLTVVQGVKVDPSAMSVAVGK